MKFHTISLSFHVLMYLPSHPLCTGHHAQTIGHLKHFYTHTYFLDYVEFRRKKLRYFYKFCVKIEKTHKYHLVHCCLQRRLSLFFNPKKGSPGEETHTSQ